MGLSKLAIGIIATTASVGAVGAITAAVVVSKQNSLQSVEANGESEIKPIPTTPNEKPSNDEARLENDLLDILIKKINKDSFAVVETKNNSEQKPIADYYAFNLKDENIKLKNGLIDNENIDVELTIDKASNTFERLNKGVLKLNLKLKNASTFETKKHSIELDGFKKGDSTLIKLLDSQGIDNPNTHKDQRLVLIPNTKNKNEFVTIQDLNHDSKQVKESNGLTTWINKSTFNADDKGIKDVIITGEIKLEKIEVKENKTYFYLTSANKDDYIKLIRKQDEKQVGELVVSYIKTTNLLATDISLVPIKKDEQKTKSFIETLIKETTEDKKFSTSKIDKNLNRNLFITIPKQSEVGESNTSDVFVKPYFVNLAEQEQENFDLEFDIQISFGNGDNVVIYKTSNETQAKLLKEMGFSFHIYSKTLSKKGNEIRKDDLVNDSLKLNTYFKNDNYKKPINKPSSTKDSTTMFDISNQITDMYKTNAKISVKKSDFEKGIIALVDYSYNPITQSENPLKDKVLFTPNLSLIHLEKPIEKA